MRKTILARAGVLGLGTALLLGMTPAAHAVEADRLSGLNRYDTAIAISKLFTQSDVVYLARGDNQADAVAGGKLTGGPLLLVRDNEETLKAVAARIKELKAKKVIVLGGVAAVSETVAKAAAGDLPLERLAGENRFDTAAAVSRYLNKETSATVYLANGMTLVDALVGGTIVNNAPILLTNGSGKLPEATVKEIKRLKPSQVIALGGEKAVSTAELNAASVINGAGGGMSEAEAKAKVETDLVKADRQAKMEVEGWYTLAKGKTIDDFLDSAAKAAGVDTGDAEKKAKVKAELETTFPRLLPSEVKADEDAAKIFAANFISDPITAKTAKETALYVPQVAGKDVANYKGLTAVAGETVPAESASLETAKNEVPNALNAGLQGNTLLGTSAFFTNLEKAVGKYLLTNAAGAYPTATSNYTELFSVLGVKDVTFPLSADGTKLAEQQKAVKDAIDALAAKVATSQAELKLAKAKADVAATAAAEARTKGATTEQIQKYRGGAGAQAIRIAGADRYQTALEIAKVAYPSGAGAKAAYVANGMAPADATVAGFIDNQADARGPVLLTARDAVPQSVVDYLKAAHGGNAALGESAMRALGGEAVVSAEALKQAQMALK